MIKSVIMMVPSSLGELLLPFFCKNSTAITQVIDFDSPRDCVYLRLIIVLLHPFHNVDGLKFLDSEILLLI
jgi:hypothetical protein